MLIEDILSGAGLEKDRTFKETRFMSPPTDQSYAVWFDSYNRRGGDYINLLTEHNYSIELYEYAPDPDVEHSIELMLDEYGLPYEKQERTWIEEEQLYQIIYEFTILAKED